MDALTETLATSFQVSEFPNNPNAPHPRFEQYKIKIKSANQEERRRRLLEEQKTQRYKYVNQVRCLAGEDFSLKDDTDPPVGMDIVDSSESAVRFRTFRNQLMLSEWLVEVPEDLASKWYFVLCPVGRRCLVVTSRGFTRAYTKSGYCINTFPSFLPGGNRRQEQKGRQYSVLDCIYSELNRTFYVLDMMCWRGHPILDSETEFRFYWLQTKLAEVPQVLSRTSENPYQFIPLPPLPCTPEQIRQSLTDQLPFDQPLDGILFYNKETHYTAGPTPLVGWLKAYMIPEMLNIDVGQIHLEARPAKYTTMAAHLKGTTKKGPIKKEQSMEIAESEG